MTLLESLIENNSILLKQKAETWEEAVNKCIKPIPSYSKILFRFLIKILVHDSALIIDNLIEHFIKKFQTKHI